MGKYVHIVLLFGLALLLQGCAAEPVPVPDASGIKITVRCDNPILSKADTEEKDGDRSFNENLIRSVDFLFYPSSEPDAGLDAVYHIRKELTSDPMLPGVWEATFNLVLKKEVNALIFKEENGNKATVYALVNFDAGFVGDLSQTSKTDLDTKRIVTDFSASETEYVQSSFLMDGRSIITFDPDATPNVVGEIEVTRFAAKLTVALNIAEEVVLHHAYKEENGEDATEPDEIWTPVPHTARIYLVDGIKSVFVGGTDPDPEYFSYKSTSRAFVKENGAPSLNTETVTIDSEDRTYYNTWPMYSYPANWSSALPDHKNIDYVGGLPPEPPYFKLEMDWRREPRNGYSYDRRKYYYKIFMPFNTFQRNNWYGFYVDVSILGSETDEGKALLEPTCYLLDWQNKALSINKYATISKARYLSLDKSSWEIDNMDELTIPFLSSHNVTVVPGTVKATRPYYGQITSTKGERVGDYNSTYHATIKQKDANNYYLDYVGQPAGNEAYEPFNWLSNTSTSIVLTHPLQNDYTVSGFDYSPYTIDFDIVHTDLVNEPASYTYQQYVKHITIVQYPGIYIDKYLNRDTLIVKKGGNIPYGYNQGTQPWLDMPWGYVYMNGGRFIRHDNISNNTSSDPYYKLTTASAKKEYQWQTVYYTGGSRDIFNIHVTVLPSKFNFIIGDSREDTVNNLDSEQNYPNLYIYTVDGSTVEDKVSNWTYLEAIRSGTDEYRETSPGVYQRVGFNSATALYGDEDERPLKWYYPTEKTTRTENMLSPSYRISSKFGGTEFGSITKPFAEYRCAGYQEDGFPGGRWRLPTKAEVWFIAQLSANKVFEFLFNSGGTYWSAHGAITVNSDGTVSNSNSTTALLRCVYDSWYWDKVDGRNGDPRMDDPSVFVWGDKER